MSLPKKGQRNQFMFPMIEADGLSVASTLTASQLRSGGTRKGWGYNHNTTTLPASIALSATASLIKSGLFNIQINAAESIYDRVNFIFTHPTCLDQDLACDFADYDDSDIMSRLDKIDSAVSDVQSYLLGVSAQISNFQSQFVSRVTGVVANTSALKSAVSSALQSTLSDIQSGIQAIATTSDLRSRLSDIQSYLAGMSGMMSDIQSGVAVGNSRLLLNRSVISDVQSYLVALSAQISDVYSAVLAAGSTSDLRSRLSDIQSYLAGMSGMMSDVQSAVLVGNSRLLLVQSNVSDIQSYLIAQSSLDSDTQSAARQGNSRALVCQSLISDVMSMLTTGELNAVPGAAPTIGTEMQFVYQKIRNRETSTSGAATIAKNDGSVIGTATLGDAASVFTKGKYV